MPAHARRDTRETLAAGTAIHNRRRRLVSHEPRTSYRNPEPEPARQDAGPLRALFLSNPAPVARFTPCPDRKHCVLDVQIPATICPCPHLSFWQLTHS